MERGQQAQHNTQKQKEEKSRQLIPHHLSSLQMVQHIRLYPAIAIASSIASS
jgi:hypothetical protein